LGNSRFFVIQNENVIYWAHSMRLQVRRRHHLCRVNP
jgi:hypothetical protein